MVLKELRLIFVVPPTSNFKEVRDDTKSFATIALYRCKDLFFKDPKSL